MVGKSQISFKVEGMWFTSFRYTFSLRKLFKDSLFNLLYSIILILLYVSLTNMPDSNPCGLDMANDEEIVII